MPAERSPARLARLLRVRTLQRDILRAEEMAAQARVASELELRARIAQLAENVAPASGEGLSFASAALYRERLHGSAMQADLRVSRAEQGLENARDATREAQRDRTAMEKLLARAEAEQVARDLRQLAEAPPLRKTRHDPC